MAYRVSERLRSVLNAYGSAPKLIKMKRETGCTPITRCTPITTDTFVTIYWPPDCLNLLVTIYNEYPFLQSTIPVFLL